MKYYTFSFLFFLLISCVEQESDNRFTQFTSDDLSFLYYNSDTLDFTGRSINYLDTITFALNGINIIRVPIETKIDTFRSPPWDMSNEAGIQGESSLILEKESGFRYATVGVSRQRIDDNGSTKYFYVSIDGGTPFGKHFYINDEIPLDTALVLGNYYNNVIKIEPDSLTQSKIKSIYFAKKFGFIKIETLDGKTMERVLPGNLGLEY
jgi:hypothetical protein